VPSQKKKQKRVVSFSTFNQQGSGKVHSSVRNHQVVFMQETGSFPTTFKRSTTGHVTGIIRRSMRLGGNLRVFGHEWGRANRRCSLAVAVAEDMFYAVAKMYLIYAKKATGLRPAVVVDTGDLVVASIHAPSGNHKFAASVADEMIREIQQQFPGKPVVIGGDMNTTPDLLSTRINGSGMRVAAPGGSTQRSGNTLDMFVYTPTQFSPTRVESTQGFQGSDHLQVSMTGTL
jgi:hypothetical protein